MNPVLWCLGFLWSLPTSLLGWLFVLFGKARFAQRAGPRRAWFYIAQPGGLCYRFLDRGGFFKEATRVSQFSGYTLGVVVVAINGMVLGCDSFVLHESEHVRQGFWLGPFFLLAYLFAALWAWAFEGNPYRDDWFEADARKAAGGKG